MSSCEVCEIFKNTFFYRTPLVAASVSNDNKPFWEKCKPYFTNKHSKVDTDIMLNENGELLLKDKDNTDTFIEYFGSTVESLNLYKRESEISDLGLNDSNQDYLDIIIPKHEQHPSIPMITQNLKPVSSIFLKHYTTGLIT